MSASSKKKLRNAEQAAKMTEKQLAEQKEAKQLKLYSTLAVVVLIVLVVFAAYVGISRTIANSGIRERNTVALTVGDHEISNAELNYFYIDTVNNFYNNYGSYASIFGLDLTLPLDEQFYDEEAGTTWGDYFLEGAVESVKAAYAIADEAIANGYTLPEEAADYIDSIIENYALYASLYGYSDTDTYIKAMYGKGASEKGLRNYYEVNYLASYYQSDYQESLTYTDEQIRAAEGDNYAEYSSFDYNYYYLNVQNFVEKAGEEATEEELAAAEKAAEEAAKALTTDINTVEAFNEAILALPVNAENTSASSYTAEDESYSDMFEGYAEWMADESRKAGDTTYVASTSTTTAEDGTETEKLNGYYAVIFNGRNDNEFPLVNVRHILVSFEGGSYDSTTGVTTYTDEEKATAKAAAEELYNEWKNGDATEDSFAALANEKSDDGDGTTGGLYEDIYPGQMVEAFEDWCFDAHEIGDTGIVETEYGYHIMFFSGNSETTYRDYMISSELADSDFEAWYNALIEAMTVTEKSFKFIDTGLVLSAS